MAVFRVHKTEDYTCMSNHHLRNKSLSLKAKGLLSVMLSLPDDWKYSIAGLAAICKEGQTAVKSALKELADARYVVVTKMYPNETDSGHIEYVYDVHEQPQLPYEQGIENLPLDNQPVENHVQLNTNKQSTEELSTDNQVRKHTVKGRKSKNRFSPPTIEEVRQYVTEKGYHFDPDAFFAYYASQDWKKGNGQRVSNWKQCCVTWELKREEKSKPKNVLPESERLTDLDWIPDLS